MPVPRFLFNVYGRLPELVTNVECLRASFGREFPVSIYCNYDLGISQIPFIPWSNWIMAPNTGHHNGTRDAYNAFVDLIENDQYYVSIHADVWASDHSLFQVIVDEMVTRDVSVGFLDPSPAGAMANRHYMGLYMDAFVLRGDAYRRLFPLHDELDDNEWIETAMYRRAHSLFSPEEMWFVPNTCGRFHHRDEPFVFDLNGRKFALSGNHGIGDRVRQLLRVHDGYRGIFERFPGVDAALQEAM